MMNAVMVRLKDAAFNTHQRMKQAAMLEAKEKWDILRGKNEVDYVV